MCTGVYLCVRICVSTGTVSVQTRASDPLELESRVVVNHLLYLLGIKSWST